MACSSTPFSKMPAVAAPNCFAASAQLAKECGQGSGRGNPLCQCLSASTLTHPSYAVSAHTKHSVRSPPLQQGRLWQAPGSGREMAPLACFASPPAAGPPPPPPVPLLLT